MTNVTIIKTLPASLMYSGSGVTTINLKNFDNMIINSKKALIKIQRPKTKKSQNITTTDQPDNQVIDLKKLEQVIKFTGWLEDDNTETAWNKFWKLIAMQTRGGPLTSLTIGTAVPLVFPSSFPAVFPTTTPEAFIESATANIMSDDTGDITASHSTKPARIKVDLDIYLGYSR
jgi:hypothetical protein